MKIWYQSLFDAGRIPAYFDGVRKRVATVARPGTEVNGVSIYLTDPEGNTVELKGPSDGRPPPPSPAS